MGGCPALERLSQMDLSVPSKTEQVSMKRILLPLALLLGGACISSADVTVQGWWHLDSTQPINDSSGHTRTFGSAYSTAPASGGNVAAQLINNGVGGPLDGTGYTSSQCIRVGVGQGGKRQSSMWGISYNPPATDFGIEIWVLPQDNGIAGGSGGWIFSSGQSGGVALRINAPGTGPSYIDAFVIGSGTTIGDEAPIDTNRWMHLAIVNDGGITTFYTNGVTCGASLTNVATVSAGDVYMISAPGDNQAFDGYLDEARMFTFDPGQFSTSDLLLRPASPNIAVQPQNTPVWNGGAALFTVTASFDNSITYQWRRDGANVSGETGPTLDLPQVTATDSGSKFDCVLQNSSGSVTSSVATLTVVSPISANVSAYRDAINGESSLIAYYPVDNDTGTTLTDTKDAAHNGALELNATYDGNTNRAFGQRAVAFNADGDVQIPNNPAFEFPGGNGTIEALVYMSQATATDPTIFSEAYDSSSIYYAIRASKDGGSLIYSNDFAGQLSWALPNNLIGKLTHVAIVFDSTNNITPYVNGQSLGTKTQPQFGIYGSGAPAWIGGMGTYDEDNRWAGTVDELAIYSTALSANEVQIHYSKFYYGTNTTAPSIVSQPASRTLLAGGSPVLVVNVAGTLPFTYQWKFNGTAIADATTSKLTLTDTTTNSSGSYTLSVQNPYGSADSRPIALTFVPPPSGYASIVMNDHPTAFWRLDDSAGPTAVDSAGGNDAIFSTNGVSFGVPSHTGGDAAVHLDGSTGRAIVPLTPTLNPNGPFTCEFWAAPDSEAFYVPVGSMDRPARSGGYEFYLDGNYPGFEFHTAAGGGYDMVTGDDMVPKPGEWTYVVGVYDGSSNIYCYIDGRHAASTTGNPGFSDNYVSEQSPPFAPNNVKGFYIGSRADNVLFFKGAISDVAFYNYALTDEQISNHWSAAFVASQVTQQPVGVTNMEGSTITLSPVVSGLPNSYQWYKDGVALQPTALNSDQTLHYPQNVTNLSLVISQATISDSGLYHLVTSNPLGNSTTADAKVLVTADTNPPVVLSLSALGTPPAFPQTAATNPVLVKVLFSKRIDPTTGGDASHYAIGGGVTISSVVMPAMAAAVSLGGDWREVFLQTSPLTPGQTYSLTITGVKDQTSVGNLVSQTPISFKAPNVSAGKLEWDYYYLGASLGTSGTPTVDQLVGDPSYGVSPETNAYLSSFDSSEITSGDLNNNPAFGSLGDHYGCSVSGWITPAVTGEYTFFLASDDASRLFLSTDANPINLQQIADESGCCHGFQDPGNPTTSNPIPLQAGQPYFIQALQTEGGGGDYVKVAWRISTDSTAAKDLQPIPGAYLSSYAPGAPPAFNPVVFTNGKITLSWSGTAVLQQSSDLMTWTPVPGNPTSPFQIDPTTGAQAEFYRLAQ